MTRQRLSAAVLAVVLALLAGGALLQAPPRALAAVSPASVSITPNGPAATWNGGPLYGYLSAGTGPAPSAACVDPACEAEAIDLAVPQAYLDNHDVTVVVTVTFKPGPIGGGADSWITDDQGNLLASSFTSPAVMTVSHLSTTHLVDVENGDIGDGVTYTGKVSATATLRPPAATRAAPVLPHDIRFTPQTIVSANWLGQEPQVSIERPAAGALPGAIDPRRVFIDWPVGSTSNISELSRSTDGGDTFRLIVDSQCAVRSRPNCLTGGGGDSIERVNGYDGTLFFGDQESLAAEAEASSTDHGDSFPTTRQFAVTAGGTGVDRQWITTVDAPGIMAGPVDSYELRAIYAYHIPAVGEYVSGIDTAGLVHPGLIPGFANVGQSGPNRVDTTSGPGRGWLYQGYRQFEPAGVSVATAPLNGFETATNWHQTVISPDTADSFPWLTLDTAGNAYMAWDVGGVAWYSYSRISDPANDPAVGGIPGSKWSPQIRISPPSMGSVQFTEIVAGDPGRLGVAYLGTPSFEGDSGTVPPGVTANWYTVAAITTNALDPAGHPSFTTGVVSDRVMHQGPICHFGTTCEAELLDRSLADMIDIDMDSDGHVGVVSMDNNDGLARADYSMGALGSPFITYSRLASGPSLLAAKPGAHRTTPVGFQFAPAGTATWPNVSGGANLPALDVVGTRLVTDGTHLIGRIDLSDATASGMTRDLAAYNATAPPAQSAGRLEYVLRFDTPTDVVYMAMDQDSSANRRFFGGVLGSANAVSGGSAVKGATYDAQPSHQVTGSESGNALLFTANLADLGLTATTPIRSVTAFAMAGPAEGSDTLDVQSMRTVDASPPFDGLGITSGAERGHPTAAQLPVDTAVASGVPNTAAANGSGAPAGWIALAALGLLVTARRRRSTR